MGIVETVLMGTSNCKQDARNDPLKVLIAKLLKSFENQIMRRIPSLKSGDYVGLVAPGAVFNKEKFEKSIEILKKMGLKPVYGKNLFAKDLMFAGTVKQRVESLRKMLARKDIKAIWCVRGGAGAYAVAQELAKDKAPKHPKLLIGMSDVTALQLLFVQKWKWPVLHGPLFDRLSVAPKREMKILKNTLFEKNFRLVLDKNLKTFGKKARARGILTGGNLALITASLGSKWEIDCKNKILFIEDLGERAYRIDRFLTQLESAGKFNGIKGVVIGDFTDCKEIDGKELWLKILKRHFEKLKVPCLQGMPMGHGELRLALPFGLKVSIDSRRHGRLEVLESVTR
jgi:muramoyltetrapeptide carboxypeptidase